MKRFENSSSREKRRCPTSGTDDDHHYGLAFTTSLFYTAGGNLRAGGREHQDLADPVPHVQRRSGQQHPSYRIGETAHEEVRKGCYQGATEEADSGKHEPTEPSTLSS